MGGFGHLNNIYAIVDRRHYISVSGQGTRHLPRYLVGEAFIIAKVFVD